jgi:formylglycine-generating enzyme required for sulfatase activity
MARFFISYSRVDSVFMAQFLKRLKRKFTEYHFWVDEELTGGDDWWKEILKAIHEADIFIYLLSNESVSSLYCKAEFTEARRLQKRIILVQVRDRTNFDSELQWVDMKKGADDVDAQDDLVRAINKQVGLIPKKKLRALWAPETPKPQVVKEAERPADAPEVDTLPLVATMPASATLTQTGTQPIPTAPQPQAAPARRPIWPVLVGVLVVLGIAGVVLWRSGLFPQEPTLTPEPTTGVVAQASDTPAAPTATDSLSPTDAVTPSDTLEPTTASNPTINPTSTLGARQELQTLEAQQTEVAARQTLDSIAATMTATLWTPTPKATTTLEARAAAGIAANADWEPVEQVFDGVTMVLVPAGCFMMGSEVNSDERPAHEVCIEAPFWLDKFEVTQADFERLGGVKANANGSDGDARPVERITWVEAEAFCRERRGGRLPTEAEWEFAARGPDGLEYPWRGEFVAENVVFDDNANETADVGEGIRTAGASWVGAHDLSGNIWEWTSSLYRGYPYDHNDGREDLAASGSRVLRGGSWLNTHDNLRATNRFDVIPVNWSLALGLRCARSPEQSEG